MLMDVKYIGHSYGCHPETCCCNEYGIVTNNGKIISKHYNLESAEQSLKLIKEALENDSTRTT